MAATGCGRDRNKVKFSKWGFYINGDGKDEHQNIMQSLRDAGKTQRSRVPGGYQALVFTKVSKNKFEIAWPHSVCADSCIKVLKKALGNEWRKFVTDPAGVQGARQEAGTAEAPVSSRGTSRLAATIASSAATAEARSGDNLLALKLEACTRLYDSREPERFEDLQSAYTVNWAAQLGQGTYGKVYVGTRRLEGGAICAIKMLRNQAADAPKAFQVDAVSAAEEEVRRYVALGLHPNVVGLADVGFFLNPGASRGDRAFIGLVFDLYEIDVRQFLKKSSFTQGGMRHVLNSVLEALRFIHDNGCIHCDLKPANIFMRGAINLRGCFEKEVLQQLGDWGAVAPCLHSRTEFQYQIPNSFEVRGGGERVEDGTEEEEKETFWWELDLRSNHHGSNSI